ncbi:MAG: PDZ domain-containing protein [Planctomycetia bacterium]|nr:PDZ domain-containing protein [Planctomycetia bacterium]
MPSERASRAAMTDFPTGPTRLLLTAVLAAGLMAAGPCFSARAWQATQDRPRAGRQGEADAARDFTPEERTNIAVYEAVNRSVVNINTKATVATGLFLLEVPSEGAGSGIVLDGRGHVLTNFHVVEGAKEIQVLLYDGSSHNASVVGFDPATDVAVLRVDAPASLLEPVTFGDSSDLRVGQRVFAIGNPFGLERTLTTGIISSLNRSLPTRSGRTIKSIIQTDAAINPGNSGGPLLDSGSRLIGMNTAIASRTGQSAGVGFAIPVGTLARIVPQLIQRGKVVRPDAGIARVYQTDKGLLVAALAPDGPAERAGVRGFKVVRERRRQGPFIAEFERVDRSGADLIVAVAGQTVRTADDFLSAVESKNPGDQVLVTVEREGHRLDIPVILDAEK